MSLFCCQNLVITTNYRPIIPQQQWHLLKDKFYLSELSHYLGGVDIAYLQSKIKILLSHAVKKQTAALNNRPIA